MMPKFLFIGKSFSKGVSTSKEVLDVGRVASKGVRTTKTLADGTKITTSVVKITRKALKGNGEVGAKTIVVLKAKLKDIKSLIKKKKRKGKSTSTQQSIKENWQSQPDVYDEWEWRAQEPFEHSQSSRNFFISPSKSVEKTAKSIEPKGEKLPDANLVNKPTINLPNQAVVLYEKTNIILPKKNIDFVV